MKDSSRQWAGAWALAALLAWGAAPARAQQTPGVRFERADRGSGVLPVRGAVRLQIGTGKLRPVRGTRLLVRIIRDRAVWSESEITQIPSIFSWNAAMVPAGDYQLQLVSGETEMDEAIEDELTARVRPLAEAAPALPIVVAAARRPAPARLAVAASAAPTPAPTAPPATAPAASPAPQRIAQAPARRDARPGPAFRLERRGSPVGLQGEAVLALEGIDRLPPGVIPTIVAVRNGQTVWRDGGCAYPPFAATWKTRDLPDGRYTLRLVLLNLKQEKKEVADEIEVRVTNRNPAPTPPKGAAVATNASHPPAPAPTAPTPTPKPAPREVPVREVRPMLIASRGAALRPIASAPSPSGASSDACQLVISVSQQAGDPHPKVAAAQWALETGWGSAQSAKNNCFGIKAAPNEPGSEKVSLETRNGKVVAEVSRFAVFGSPIECILARLAFLRKPRYAAYWAARTDEEACLALQAGGYATDPEYALKLIRAMRRIP